LRPVRSSTTAAATPCWGILDISPEAMRAPREQCGDRDLGDPQGPWRYDGLSY
jgi:hypothetical protein